MGTLDYLIQGFASLLTIERLAYCVLGCLAGTIVGVLPGLGPLAGMTLLLPLTFSLDPTTGIIMLAGIFYGSMYGGSTTSILMRIPGESASIITCLDGYEMARKGRAGPALVVAALGSFFAGTVSIVGLMFFAPPFADLMLKVGPAAEFVLMVLALLVLGFVSSGPPLKTFTMIVAGLALGTVGLDPFTAWPRFTFGFLQLTEGLNIVALAIGLFGISEILINLEGGENTKPIQPRLRELVPRMVDLRASAPAVARGSLIGFIFGIIPGASHVISTFVSYAVEKRISKQPEEFGHGAIAGVAGPEAANNATTGSAMIPLLVLGIPSISATAILLSALTVHGVQPGPLLIAEHPGIFWGLIASMYLGNFVLLVLNLPLVGLFVNLLRFRYAYLATTVLLTSIIGVYSVNYSMFDIWVMIASGAAGYLLRKFEFDPTPLLLSFVLSAGLEVNFRRALSMSNGDFSIFIQGGAAQMLLAALVALVVLQGLAALLGYRRSTFRT